MEIKIALAGNPNCGKTTLFNALTGSNQFVGNWPGVTVEKKEGRMKDRADVIVTDLPGIYSLSPFSLEEVVARNYLIDERPDAILNIVDGTNLERNLYLTTQLIEIGIPVVIAINMMDIIRRNGDYIDKEGLSRALGCPVVEISALQSTGVVEAANAAIEAARSAKRATNHSFSGAVEHALAHIEEAVLHSLPKEKQRWYAVKLFERDEKVAESLGIRPEILAHVEEDIADAERELDDDSESIIANERYVYIASVLKDVYKRKRPKGNLSTSDKIDKVLTNRFAALPIFAVIMFLVYYISVTTVGTWVTDWMNDGVFGDGWHLFGIGESAYSDAVSDYASENLFTEELEEKLAAAKDEGIVGADKIYEAVKNKDYEAFDEAYSSFGAMLVDTDYDISAEYDAVFGESAVGAPDRADFPVWVPGVPALLDMALLDGEGAPVIEPWLYSLIMDGIVGGVGAVLGFVPQIFVLFILLAFLEACGYMSRIAFVMDRIFKKFGLSGKSFIPILIGTGCGVPGIMASRTIENERDRRMTIITTTFIPCGAKLPVIALISGALFGGAWWVAPLAYFIGMAAIVISGIILKKTKMFAGEPSPFVMELPAYHMPTLKNVLLSMWERGWSFIKKAGTIILLSSIVIWLGSSFGFESGRYVFSQELPIEETILGGLGIAIGWIFAPLGFAGIETSVATIMGLLAKEEIVAVLGVLDFIDMTKLAAFSFLTFNLLCAPCFAAIAAIKREMNSAKWTWFAIGYQTGFAYAVSFCIYQIGSFLIYRTNVLGAIIALGIIVAALYLLFRPARRETVAKNA